MKPDCAQCWFCGLTPSGRPETRVVLSKKRIKHLSSMFHDYKQDHKRDMQIVVRLFPVFQEVELKKIEMNSTLRARDTPPASQPPCSCSCRAGRDADAKVYSWAVDAFSVDMSNAGFTAHNLRCRLSL